MAHCNIDTNLPRQYICYCTVSTRWMLHMFVRSSDHIMVRRQWYWLHIGNLHRTLTYQVHAIKYMLSSNEDLLTVTYWNADKNKWHMLLSLVVRLLKTQDIKLWEISMYLFGRVEHASNRDLVHRRRAGTGVLQASGHGSRTTWDLSTTQSLPVNS